MTTPRRVILTALAALLALPAAASAQDRHSDSMSFVKNLPFEVREDYGQSTSYGTDVEFGNVKGKRYAFAGSELNGLQIVDISSPKNARIVTAYDCAVSQGDTQVFKRGANTYVTYTNDYEETEQALGSDCYREAQQAGFDVAQQVDGRSVAEIAQGRPEELSSVSRLGTLIIDVTNVKRPRTVSFVEFPKGSHNMTVHPSGKYLYNSNSDLITSVAAGAPAIEVVDIRNLAKPVQVDELEFSALPGLGTESHDITFNDEGTRAYSAALSHGVIINTEDPANPSIISEYDDESINVWHQTDPVTIGGREFVIAEDEFAGAAGPGVCPTGGVHVFDVSDETRPVKVGYWNIDDPAVGGPLDTCTAHVFDIHEDEQIMTIAYYMGGVRVVDLSGLADAPLGAGQGDVALGGAMREIGSYVMEDANAWSAKTPYIEKDGDFWLYADDINRGLDVFRFHARRAAKAGSGSGSGEFLSPAAAERKLAGVSLETATKRQRSNQVLCLLKGARRQ